MVKRPFTIVLISLIYLFSPFLNILQAAVINRVPIIGYNSVFSLLLISDIVVLFLYIVCAVSVFMVKKWGWYAFICSSFYLITYNFITLGLNPRYSILLIIGYDFVLTVVAFIFFRKNLIAPFFNPKLRWWETEPRYMIGISLELKTAAKNVIAEIADLSISGCYILRAAGLDVGKNYDARVNCMGDSISVTARVVRKSKSSDEEQGYGIMFTAMDEQGKQGMDRIITKLKKTKIIKTKQCPADLPKECSHVASRFIVRNKAILHDEDGVTECALLNLSKNGCMVRTEKTFPLDVPCGLDLECASLSTAVKGVIRWKIESGSSGIMEYGIHFLKPSPAAKKRISMIIRWYTGVGAVNRLKIAKPVDEEVIDKSVENTPYKIILTVKKLIQGQQE